MKEIKHNNGDWWQPGEETVTWNDFRTATGLLIMGVSVGVGIVLGVFLF